MVKMQWEREDARFMGVSEVVRLVSPRKSRRRKFIARDLSIGILTMSTVGNGSQETNSGWHELRGAQARPQTPLHGHLWVEKWLSW